MIQSGQCGHKHPVDAYFYCLWTLRRGRGCYVREQAVKIAHFVLSNRGRDMVNVRILANLIKERLVSGSRFDILL